MSRLCAQDQLNGSAHTAARYEALFRVSDCLMAHRDLAELLRALPYQLKPVLEFDYISVFLNRESHRRIQWYVFRNEDPPILIGTQEAPGEEAHVSSAFDRQQPAVITEPQADRLSGECPVRSGCALPLSAGGRRLGAIFLACTHPGHYSEQEMRFISFVANRIALIVNNVIVNEPESRTPYGDVRLENIALRDEVASVSRFEEIVGSSEALDRVLANVTRVAPTETTVLITGETGTGKELIARAIHNESRRSGRAFVRVNCAAIPPSLIASELFGYEKGAFTGANQRHPGRFEQANGGTIFLDEIGDIPAETQIALLRVLQERELERIGGIRTVPIDVRVIAATNRDLRAAVNAGTFRLDLFYRLSVFPVHVPSLRERCEDIALLTKYFIERSAGKARTKINKVERETLRWLESYDWPGNIRELQNVVERAMILCDGDTFSIDKSWLRREEPGPVVPAGTFVDQEREIIEAALDESGGRISGPSGAAGKLGLPRTTLESKIKSLRIDKHQFKCA